MFDLRTLTAVSLCLAGAATVLSSGLLAQDDATAEPPPMAGEPTAVHKKLLEGVGDWVGTIEASYPGMPEMKSEATETVTALGPYHTVSDFHCEFMGMGYHGHGVTGYDPDSETLHGTWTDNFNTYTFVKKGKMDLETGIADMIYEAPMPDGSGKIRHRDHIEQKKDAYSIHFYMGAEGEELHFMTVSMKRKKK